MSFKTKKHNNKKYTLDKAHSLAAKVFTALWGLPSFAYILFFLYTNMQKEGLPHYPEMKLTAWIVIVCVVGIISVGTIFFSKNNKNTIIKNSDLNNDNDYALASLVFLPVHIFWMFAYTITFILLYIPMAPLYIFKNTVKKN